MYVQHGCACHHRLPSEGIGFPGTGVTGAYARNQTWSSARATSVLKSELFLQFPVVKNLDEDENLQGMMVLPSKFYMWEAEAGGLP